MRVSARLLRKSPGFFLTSTFTLALGIAATTAMLSVVNAVLLRLPFGHPNRLVEERRRDIGIRLALGAAPRQIRWLVIANAGALVIVGLVLGIPAFLLVGWVRPRLPLGRRTGYRSYRRIDLRINRAVGPFILGVMTGEILLDGFVVPR